MLAQAEAIDRKRKAGQPVGWLGGLPVAVKDLLCTKGEVTTCASRILENFRPPYDATVVAKLRGRRRAAGQDQSRRVRHGGSTENSAYQITRNPWDLDRIPGGSSGGAAACVAARMAPLAIGTDTGGSIREPAGLCGVTGMKPTYGRVSRYGLVAFASSLDQIGPLARTVEDAALLLEVLAGHDPRDSTSIDRPCRDTPRPVAAACGTANWAGQGAFCRRPGCRGGSGHPNGRQVYESLGATVNGCRCRTANTP